MCFFWCLGIHWLKGLGIQILVNWSSITDRLKIHPCFLKTRARSGCTQNVTACLWLHFINLNKKKSSEPLPKSTKRITAPVEQKNSVGIHTENPSRCYRAEGKCIGTIPSDIRATFLSLLLPPPQLSRIQVDSDHQVRFVYAYGCCVKRAKVSVKAGEEKRSHSISPISCPAMRR